VLGVIVAGAAGPGGTRPNVDNTFNSSDTIGPGPGGADAAGAAALRITAVPLAEAIADAVGMAPADGLLRVASSTVCPAFCSVGRFSSAMVGAWAVSAFGASLADTVDLDLVDAATVDVDAVTDAPRSFRCTVAVDALTDAIALPLPVPPAAETRPAAALFASADGRAGVLREDGLAD
jgi:hypothetical protein